MCISPIDITEPPFQICPTYKSETKYLIMLPTIVFFVYRQVLNMAHNLVYTCFSRRIRPDFLLVPVTPGPQTEPSTSFQLSYGTDRRHCLWLPSSTCNAILCKPGHVCVSSTDRVPSATRISCEWVSSPGWDPAVQFQGARAIRDCVRPHCWPSLPVVMQGWRPSDHCSLSGARRAFRLYNN